MADSTSFAAFWDLVDPLLDEPDIDRGTIMRFDCLRVGGQFAASAHHSEEGMIIKLPEERVAELINAGSANPFAPAGRVFREWAHVTEAPELWGELVAEAVAFARSGQS